MKSLLVRLAAVALLGAGAVAVPSAASAHESCESPEDVPVVLEFGSLEGGEDRVVCAQHSAGETAIEAINDAGIETAESSGAMPMVCRIEGLPAPEDEKCGAALDGDGYWAFMVAQEGQDWAYASVGLQEYELKAGDFVALKYHLMSDGENVEVAKAADASTRAEAEVAGAHGEQEGEHAGHDDEDESSFATVALPVAVVAVLLVAVAAFVVARRRRD